MTREYRAIHRAADRIEDRMARAIEVATERLRDQIPYHLIEDALERGDVRHVNDILSRIPFEATYEPSAELLTDAVIRGGKIADEEISS